MIAHLDTTVLFQLQTDQLNISIDNPRCHWFTCNQHGVPLFSINISSQ